MEIRFSDRMGNFEEGIFQALNEKKNERLAQGKQVYNLSVGTPDFQPAQHIIDAVMQAASRPENYKYALADLPELTEAVIGRFKKRYGVELAPEEIMSVYGSQEGMTHIGLTLCNPGDRVLVPNPGYPIFSIGPALAGAELIPYDLLPENQFLPDLEGMDEALLKRVKFMIVSYPMNPIGRTAPRSFYERLIDWAREKEIVIIHDNAYSDIIYDGREGISILSVEGAREVCAEFYSLSKSYNYTGARMGFLAGSKEIVDSFRKLRSQIDYGIFLPVQYGAIAALKGPDDMIREQCAQYQKRRDALCGGLRSIGWNIPDSEGTMFAWGAIPEKFGADDTAFVMELMEKSGVLCTPGSSFGSLGRGHVRFALTLPVEQLQEAVRAVEASGILLQAD
ncbi:MAG: aminotransferase class I/II-fold pyridoxal phosphate-dependent enzyme [Lachnospiraceae bacterium]|nr:aminotransferase class I/II-fold pyridoxal phosphate-dependent enzyme [Lachnospiraceae bacterium]